MSTFLPRIALLVVSLLALSAGAARAQTATLEGTVTDTRDGVLVSAAIELVDTEPLSAVKRTVETDDAGRFRIDLAPGRYFVTVRMPGFQPVERTLVLESGETRTLEVALRLAPVAQQVDVVAVSPLQGAGIDRDRVPSTVSVLTADDLGARRALSLADALNERLGAVSIEGATGSPFQPTLRFRGFTASPLLGLPQGVAVYQNGVRINESFGDTVQFDLIPQFAIERVQLSAGAEPTFGLNALGGALAMRLKNGFNAPGLHGEVLAGSFHRISGTAEYGVHRGRWALYAGVNRFSDASFRTASDSDLLQAVADIGYRGARVDAGFSVTFAETTLNGNGPAPVELLRADRSAVFTFPDTTDNRLAFGQGRASVVLTEEWSLQLTGFYRNSRRETVNGDAAELDVCDDGAAPVGAPATTLCAGEEDDPEADVLVDVHGGGFLTLFDGVGDGVLNRTATRAEAYGGSVQSVGRGRLFGRENVFTAGLSMDIADVDFASSSELGMLTPERRVNGSGRRIGVFGEAPDDRFNTSLITDNRAVGLYFSDTISWTDRLHLTVSGRFNDVQITIHDRLGTSLEGDHRFTRFNPGIGAVLRLSPGLSVFGRYVESSRSPTAAELSCADPAEPCRVPNAFLSDPPLEQAVARSFEAGARGAKTGRASEPGALEWSVTTYRTLTRDDILFVASPIIGAGFFQNAGDTQRLGVDIDVSGRALGIDWYASYGLVDASFETPLTLPGHPDVNDAVTDDGIQVEPGDRLPGIPLHSLKAGAHLTLTPAWTLTVEGIAASSRVFVGDEGGDQEPLPGYGILNLRSVFALSERVELFARINNLLDASYATFGILAELEVELAEAPDASLPRFVSPGAPRSAFAGVSIRF